MRFPFHTYSINKNSNIRIKFEIIFQLICKEEEEEMSCDLLKKKFDSYLSIGLL